MNNLGINYDDGDITINTEDVGVAEALEDFLRMKGRALLVETIGWICLIMFSLSGTAFLALKVMRMFTEVK